MQRQKEHVGKGSAQGNRGYMERGHKGKGSTQDRERGYMNREYIGHESVHEKGAHRERDL